MDEHCVQLSSGYIMPIIGLGMWQIEEEELVSVALEAAIDAGYRHIDTAFAYKNEAFIGKTLKKIFEKGTVKREDLFITTKLPGNGMKPENVEEFFKKSLQALQLDYVDLYLIHSPFASQRTADDNEIFCIRNGVFRFDASVDFVDTWRAMEALVHKGLVKSIGLSNFNSLQIQRIYDSAEVKPTNVQVECHAYFPQHELQEYCRLLSISLTAYAPLGSPGLAPYAKEKGFLVEKQDPLLADDKLKPLCVKHKKTAAQILLRYLVQRGIAVIPKSANPKRIEENIKIFDFKLDDEDMKILMSMKKKRMFHCDFAKGMKEHPEYPFDLPF